MTKRELASELCHRVGIKFDLALRCVEAMMDATFQTLADGENIYLRGLGTLKLEQRKAKVARNISAGTSVEVPAHKVVKFVPCKDLKDSVRNA